MHANQQKWTLLDMAFPPCRYAASLWCCLDRHQHFGMAIYQECSSPGNHFGWHRHIFDSAVAVDSICFRTHCNGAIGDPTAVSHRTTNWIKSQSRTGGAAEGR